MFSKSRLVLYGLGGIFIFCADQALKFLARSHPTYTAYIADPWLGWEYFENSGIAFSLPIPNGVVVFMTPLVLLALCILLTKNLTRPLVALGLILIIAGAVSNYIDRTLFAVTIDYIRIYTSIINLGDISIVAGVILLLFPKKDIHPQP